MKKINKNLAMTFGNEKPEEPCFPTSLLKSNVQKCVRRGDVVRAVRSAWFWYKQDPLDALRRLPIILCEDVMACSAIGRLVDMAKEYSSKKRRTTMLKDKIEADKKFFLQTVERAARCKWRDYEYVQYLYSRKNINKLPTEMSGGTTQEREFVDNIRSRKAMFGMRGDMWMLEITAREWTDRFQKKQFTVSQIERYFPEATLDYESVCSGPPDTDDILPETIDPHCSGIVAMLLKKPLVVAAVRAAWGDISQELMETKLRTTLFYARSWLNFKTDIISGKIYDKFGTVLYSGNPLQREKIRRVNEEIAVEVYKLSRWIIQQSLKN